MIPGKKFNPSTETSKRPTPEKFKHLRTWIAVDEKFIDITNITELKNINVQLEQSSKLFVSNVISRVIAQLLGAYEDGFVTLEATAAGALKVAVLGSTHTILTKAINLNGAGPHTLVTPPTGERVFITNIMFTVSDDVDVVFYSDAVPISGDMHFGGTDEPRGMVQHFGDYPMRTLTDKPFKIGGGAGVDIDGYMTYYTY